MHCKTRAGRAHQFVFTITPITHLVCCWRQNGGLYLLLFLQWASLVPTSNHGISYADAIFFYSRIRPQIYVCEDENPILFSSTWRKHLIWHSILKHLFKIEMNGKINVVTSLKNCMVFKLMQWLLSNWITSSNLWLFPGILWSKTRIGPTPHFVHDCHCLCWSILHVFFLVHFSLSTCQHVRQWYVCYVRFFGS